MNRQRYRAHQLWCASNKTCAVLSTYKKKEKKERCHLNPDAWSTSGLKNKRKRWSDNSPSLHQKKRALRSRVDQEEEDEKGWLAEKPSFSWTWILTKIQDDKKMKKVISPQQLKLAEKIQQNLLVPSHSTSDVERRYLIDISTLRCLYRT